MRTINITAIVQARMGSTRLPNKVMMPIEGKPMLQHVMERLSKSRMLERIIIATTDRKEDDIIERFCANMKESDKPLLKYSAIFRGSSEDVLKRYADTVRKYGADIIVRITADCPFIDARIMDRVIRRYIRCPFCDYCSNINPPTYPDGLDVEVFSRELLFKADNEAKTKFEREHVTPYMRRTAFSVRNVEYYKDLSGRRLTVDTKADMLFASAVYAKLGKNHTFGMEHILEVLRKNPKLLKLNAGLKRNEKMKKQRGYYD